MASDLLAVLPGPIADQLKKWINEFIAGRQYGNASVNSELDALATAIQTVVARPDVVSRLQIDPADAAGDTMATHTLEALRYQLYGGRPRSPCRSPPAPRPARRSSWRRRPWVA